MDAPLYVHAFIALFRPQDNNGLPSITCFPACVVFRWTWGSADSCTLGTVRECYDDGVLPLVLLRINIAIGRHMCMRRRASLASNPSEGRIERALCI